MAFKSFESEVFGITDGDTGDVAQQIVRTDYDQNTNCIYEESSVAVDKKRVDFADYQIGKTTKRKKKKNYNRKGEVIIDDGGLYEDFSSKNKYYEDVHKDRIHVQAEQEALTDEQKNNLKGGLQKLVSLRCDKEANNDLQALKGENLKDFLDRIRENKQNMSGNTQKNKKSKNDKNDYDWILSTTRNKREFQVNKDTKDDGRIIDDDDDDDENGVFVTSKLSLNNDDEWINEHSKRNGDGEKKQNEIPIQI